MISINATDIKLSPAAQKLFNESNYPELDKNIKNVFAHFKTVLESDPPYNSELSEAWQELVGAFLDKMVVYQGSEDIGKPADVWHAEKKQ